MLRSDVNQREGFSRNIDAIASVAKMAPTQIADRTVFQPGSDTAPVTSPALNHTKAYLKTELNHVDRAVASTRWQAAVKRIEMVSKGAGYSSGNHSPVALATSAAMITATIALPTFFIGDTPVQTVPTAGPWHMVPLMASS